MSQYLRDPSGQPIRLGRVRKERVADFLDGTVPAWMTVSTQAATPVSAASTTGQGRLSLTTTATNNSTASLSMPTITPTLTDCTEIRMTLEGVLLDSPTCSVELQLRNDTAKVGVAAAHASTDTYPKFDYWNTAATRVRVVDITGNQFYTWRGSGGSLRYAQKHNITFVLRPRAQQAFVLEDEQVAMFLDVPFAIDGAVTPTVVIQTKEAVAHTLSFAQFKFSVESNG